MLRILAAGNVLVEELAEAGGLRLGHQAELGQLLGKAHVEVWELGDPAGRFPVQGGAGER